MKKITFLIALFMVTLGYSQVDLPWDFETTPVTGDITSFDGATTTVEAVVAPQSTGNASTNLAKMVRDGGQVWAGAIVATSSSFDFAAKPYITAQIWTEAPIGTTIMFKTEEQGNAGNNSGEKNYTTTTTSAWETVVFDFTGVGNANQNALVMIPANGVLGDGTATSTFFIDNVENVATLSAAKIKNIAFSTYPNPTQDSWMVKTKNIKMSSIQVFDVLGKNVLSLKPNTTQVEINGSSLKTGIYFAKVKTAEGVSSLKLVKE